MTATPGLWDFPWREQSPPSAGPLATVPVLRPYQEAALDQISAALAAGHRAPLVVLPTGSGKTVIAAELMRRWVDTGKTCLFLAPRRELIFQTSGKLKDIGLSHGVLLAGADDLDGLDAPVQVASVDTLLARSVRRSSLTLPDFDLVIVDEAHLGISQARQTLFNLWPNAIRVGLTATPTRKDGKALGALYDTLLEPATVQGLTDLGHLVPARYYSWPSPDLSAVHTVAGEFNQKELGTLADRPELLADVVTTWLKLAGDRRTVVFAINIAHSMALAAEFAAHGIAAEHVDAETPNHLRLGIMDRFRKGTTQVLCNCTLASYGFDLPALSCVQIAKPTKSLMLYLQMLGRGLRPADGKSDCVVLDHGGCAHRFGMAADAREWTLEGKTALVAPTSTTREPKKPHECPQCHHLFRGTNTCPGCGFILKPRGERQPTIPGELEAFGHLPGAEKELARKTFYLELRGYAETNGYRSGWAAYKYKAKHGKFPPWSWNDPAALLPSPATDRWILAQRIAYAKSQQRRLA